MKEFNIQKTQLKPYHYFYLGFFVLYFLAQYYFLYHINGLQPFQVSIHFFSNVIGSLSKRFLSEAAPYSLIFFLIYYTKATWKRNLLAVIFMVIFSINVLTIAHYFFNDTNWRLDTLVINAKLVGSALITPAIGFVIVAVALKFKNGSKQVWLFKKRLFLVLLILLTLLSPFIPIRYSLHRSLITTQEDVVKFFRVLELEQAGTTLVYWYSLTPL